MGGNKGVSQGRGVTPVPWAISECCGSPPAQRCVASPAPGQEWANGGWWCLQKNQLFEYRAASETCLDRGEMRCASGKCCGISGSPQPRIDEVNADDVFVLNAAVDDGVLPSTIKQTSFSIEKGEQKEDESFSLGRRATLLRGGDVFGVPLASTGSSSHDSTDAHSSGPATRQPGAALLCYQQIHALAQMVKEMQQAILQLSGEVRDLRIAVQSVVVPAACDQREKLPIRRNVDRLPASAVPPLQQSEQLSSVSSCISTSFHVSEDASRNRVGLPFSEEGVATVLDASIINALFDGLKELEVIPLFFST